LVEVLQVAGLRRLVLKETREKSELQSNQTRRAVCAQALETALIL
jgi:hypothetical protein